MPYNYFKNLQDMMLNNPQQSDNPQADMAAMGMMQYMGDKADPTDTRGAQPTGSPIDFIGEAPALAKSMASYAPEILANQASLPIRDSQALAAQFLNKQNSAKNQAIQDFMSKISPTAAGVRAYQRSGISSPSIEPALSSGDTAAKIVNALDSTPSAVSPNASLEALNKPVAPSGADATLPLNVYRLSEAKKNPTSYQEAPNKFVNLADLLRNKK